MRLTCPPTRSAVSSRLLINAPAPTFDRTPKLGGRVLAAPLLGQQKTQLAMQVGPLWLGARQLFGTHDRRGKLHSILRRRRRGLSRLADKNSVVAACAGMTSGGVQGSWAGAASGIGRSRFTPASGSAAAAAAPSAGTSRAGSRCVVQSSASPSVGRPSPPSSSPGAPAMGASPVNGRSTCGGRAGVPKLSHVGAAPSKGPGVTG